MARLRARVIPLPPQRHLTLARPVQQPQYVQQPQPSLPRPDLTDREIEVLRAWLRTDTKEEAAAHLHIAMGTINTHIARARAKYAAVGRTARTKAALLARVVQDGIMTLEEL